MDVQNIVLWAILIGGLIYETTMFLYNKWKKGEPFSLEKYAMTYGYVGLLATIAYFTTGAIPEVSAIIANLGESLPDPTIVFTAISTLAIAIYQQGSRYFTGKTTPATTDAAAVEQAEGVATVPAVAGSVDWLSFKMTPSFPAGVSPFTQLFKFYATQPQPDHPGVASVDVDWDDGTPVQNVPMKDGYAEVSHTFVYVQGTSPYYAKQFSPVFTAVGSDGSKKRYNLTTDGFTKFCMVEVQSIITGTKPMPQ